MAEYSEHGVSVGNPSEPEKLVEKMLEAVFPNYKLFEAVYPGDVVERIKASLRIVLEAIERREVVDAEIKRTIENDDDYYYDAVYKLKPSFKEFLQEGKV